MSRIFFVAFGPVLLLPLPALGQDNWPGFRGPASGVVQAPLPERWSTTENVVWKSDVPGRGWSSPIVWGDRIFLTTVGREGKYDEVKKGLYLGGNRLTPPADAHRFLVCCYDFRTGKLLWESEAHKGAPPMPVHLKNSYASETPVTDGDRVYACFGNVGVFCFDRDGKAVWSHKYEPRRMRFGWGTAASPVLHGDRLYLVNDNEEKSYLLALDRKTGKELWRQDRDEKSNWATPFVWQNDQRTELVTPGTSKVRSYDLDGKLLWEMAGMSGITIPTPLAGHGLLFVGSGYVLDRNRPLYAIRPGAAGDITLPADDASSKHVAWSLRTAAPYNPSPLLAGDYLYVLYDRGFLACFDARSGKEIYDKQRLGPGATAFTSSPWVAGHKIYCLSEDGDTFVVEAGPKFSVQAINKLDEMCLATPAAVRGSLIVRTLTRLYRIEKPKG